MPAEPAPSPPPDDLALPEMAGRSRSRSGTWTRAGVVLLVAAPYIAASAVGWTVCVAAGLTGYPCPGCGLTRASVAALHGDWGHAFHLHPLFPMAAPLYAYLVCSVAYRYVAGNRARPLSQAANRVVTMLAAIAIVALSGVWIARFFGAFGGPAEVHSWASLIR